MRYVDFTPLLHFQQKFFNQQNDFEKKQTLASERMSGSLSCIRPAVSTNTTSVPRSTATNIFKNKNLKN